MFDALQDENSIKAIAKSLPKKLVKAFDKKEFYTSDEVDTLFLEVFDTKENLQYAYAMFCSANHFAEIAKLKDINATYGELRTEVADKCFEGWPRFNFESFLNLNKGTSRTELVNEITDMGLNLLS